MRRGQSEQLVPMCQAVMRRAGLAWSALDCIAVTRGPGGFTGVRIGLAAAEGLALAWDLPVIGVSGFVATAASVPPDERIGRHLVVLIDAKRAEVYAQFFDEAAKPLSEPALLSEAALLSALPQGPLLLAGDAACAWFERLGGASSRAVLSRASARLSASQVARVAAGLPKPARPWPRVAPLYLREADTTTASKPVVGTRAS